MAGASDGAMQRQILGKLDSILHHFSREIHAAGDIFHENKVGFPPLKFGFPKINTSSTFVWPDCCFTLQKHQEYLCSLELSSL